MFDLKAFYTCLIGFKSGELMCGLVNKLNSMIYKKPSYALSCVNISIILLESPSASVNRKKAFF